MAETKKIRLVLADDHALVREGIRSSLVHYREIAIVGEAANGREAVQKCKDLSPDIILIDLNMPEMTGLEATPLIRKNSPNTKVIALTVHDTKEYVAGLLRAGAHGYVLKDTSPEELVRAIHSVAAGQAFFSPSISRVLLEDYLRAPEESTTAGEAEISAREQQVLRLVADGRTSKDIALQFKISVRTVETYRVRLKRKLQARNVAELLTHARERGLL